MATAPAKTKRAHYTLSVPDSFREALNRASEQTGVPGTIIVQRLVNAWMKGKIKIADLNNYVP